MNTFTPSHKQKTYDSLDFSSLSPKLLAKQTSLIAAEIHEFMELLSCSEMETNQYLQKINYFLESLDRIDKPVDHLLKVTRNEKLRKAHQHIKQHHAQLVSKLMEHPSFSEFLTANTLQGSDPDISQFRKSLIQKASLQGLNLASDDSRNVQQLHQDLATLQSEFRARVTTAALKFPDLELTFRSNPDPKQRESAWRERYSLNTLNGMDTRSIIEKEMRKRQTIAGLLGHRSYSHLMATHQTIGSAEKIDSFLAKTAEQILPVADRNLKDITAFAGKNGMNQDTLYPWDVAYWTEKYVSATFLGSNPREYFEMDRTVNEVINIIEDLFQLELHRVDDVPTWHPSVKVYDWYDRQENHLGRQYLDLIARPGSKSIGAWKSTIYHGSANSCEQFIPVCGLQTNFPEPTDSSPSLLTWDNVRTLFHEFGHCLHELCCSLPFSTLSGTQVTRDILEYPSSFMESFWSYPDVIKRVGRHYQTGDSIPDSVVTNQLKIEKFKKSLNFLRRLKLSVFDFRLHESNVTDFDEIHRLYYQTEKEYGLIEIPHDTWPETSFNHIFAGDYAVGYYGYIYALLYACDASSLFAESTECLNAELGVRFRKTVLSQGNAAPMDTLHERFMSRPVCPETFFQSLR